MRGDDLEQAAMFSYISAEQRVGKDHPLRAIRRLADEALAAISPHLDTLYARGGRPSIAPEKLVRALLLQALHSIKSERQLMEQIDFNISFRWFVGLSLDDAIWDVTVFTKNRERLIAGEVSERLLVEVVEQARRRDLLSEDHFTVDGTLLQAWANRRSFAPKPTPPERGTGARGRKLLRDTHESKTDPEARLFKKSAASAAVPSYLGHLVTENRNGLVVAAGATQAATSAEREAALALIDRMQARRSNADAMTLGADRSYQEATFVEALRRRRVIPHVAEYAPNPKWPNFLTAEERSGEGFGLSQRKRKLVEKVFGWMKLDRSQRQVKFRGLKRVDWMFRLTAAAHNLRRMQTLLQAA